MRFILLFLWIYSAFAFNNCTHNCRHNCSWNYRFDSENNHFNLVYPDKNAVYYGMILPAGASSVEIKSSDGHPIADYFSIQIYDSSDLVNSMYHFNDYTLIAMDGLTDPRTEYNLIMELNANASYFFLFRIYNSRLPTDDKNTDKNDVYYWAGSPPETYINEQRSPLCNIDYTQQGNIYTNITKYLYPTTNTVCMKNEVFMFMEVPSGSLANADANYMIACISPGILYTVTIRMPWLMCSLWREHPYINETYDLRYASLSVVSTTAPRPTITTYKIPCNVSTYTVQILVDEAVVLPGLLYRQLLPNPHFKNSIAHAKSKCYDYVDSTYDDYCISSVMGDYYPTIV